MGTGLGLRIVKSFVDLMDGSVIVQSEPGKGSSFIVEIPCRIVSEEKRIDQAEQSMTETSLKHKRILLVEDNELNVEIARTILEDAQAEGCQILQLQAPDHIEADENGHVTALWTRPQVIGPYGSDGRPRPYDADAPLLRTPCDIVIVAIGQAIDARPFAQVMPLERGKIKASSDAFVPNTPHVFAGGDAVTGPATVIRAVAAGKVAAANIDAHLGFHHVIQSDVEIPAPHLTNLPACGRIELHNRPSEECVGNFELVKCGMTEQEVQQETSRCLRCDHFGYGIFKGGRTSKW